MMEMRQLMDQTYDETDEIEEIIDQELRARIQAFGREVQLLSSSCETVNVKIKKITPSLFDIRSEILERMVISKVKQRFPKVRNVVVTFEGSTGN